MFVGGITMVSYIHSLYGNFAKIFYLVVGSLMALLSSAGIGILISMIYEIKKGKIEKWKK